MQKPLYTYKYNFVEKLQEKITRSCYNSGIMIRFLVFSALLCLQSLNAFSFKDQLLKGEIGDYIISAQGKSFTLLRLHAMDGSILTLEEIAIPSKVKNYSKEKLENWMKEGAPGNTSWHLIETDLEKNQVLECYSFTKKAWLVLDSNDSLITKIAASPLTPLPKEERRKIGPAPLDGFDTRKVWNPPLVFEGKTQKKTTFDTYTHTFEKDGSMLSNKRLEVYFDAKNATFPFPYWARITDDSNASFKMRVINSGKGLISPAKEIPKGPLAAK